VKSTKNVEDMVTDSGSDWQKLSAVFVDVKYEEFSAVY